MQPQRLQLFLDSLGDSLVLVDDEEIIKVHVHTNDPGKALHEAIEYGSFVTVKIENMRLQHTEKVMTEAEKAPKIAEPEKTFGVVSVCAGDGLADVFMDLGVDGIISHYEPVFWNYRICMGVHWSKLVANGCRNVFCCRRW